MARKKQEPVIEDGETLVEGDDQPQSGTERITAKDGSRKLPEPAIESKPAVAAKAPEKKADPNKPKDVTVTSAHLVKVLAKNTADNRLTRLTEKARRDNDVKWLLAEYVTLSKSK
jgi:hypothetical protein